MLETTRLEEVLLPFVRVFAGAGEGRVIARADGDATRRCQRVEIAGGDPQSVVIVEPPNEPLKSDEASPKLAPGLPFLNLRSYRVAEGLPVPRDLRADLGFGLIALEDHGDRRLERVVVAASSEERAHRDRLPRKLEGAGRFVFIDRVRKNPSFLRWIPTTIGYVREALARAPVELGRLREALGRRVAELGSQ